MTPAIFIFELREKAVSRHIASNINGRRSTIDDRTTIPGYSISPDLYSLGEGSAPAPSQLELTLMRLSCCSQHIPKADAPNVGQRPGCVGRDGFARRTGAAPNPEKASSHRT